MDQLWLAQIINQPSTFLANTLRITNCKSGDFYFFFLFPQFWRLKNSRNTSIFGFWIFIFSFWRNLSRRKKSSRKFRQSGKEVHEVHRFPKASFGLCCNRKRTAATTILLLGFFIVVFPTIVFAGHFSAREVAPVEVERELETEILHQQWSLNKTALRERVVDSKKLVPEKKP